MAIKNRKVRVMHFVPTIGIGGAETLVKNYLINFDENEFDVVLLCLKHAKGSFYEKELAKKNIRVVYIEDYLMPEEHFALIAKIVNYFYRRILIRSMVRDKTLDVLHIHFATCAFLKKYARPRRKTVIIRTIHNEPKTIWFDGKREKLDDFRATKWFLRHYNMRFIVLHETMRVEINKIFGISNSIILNNGIDISKYKDVECGNDMRKKLDIPENTLVIGHIGRFFAQKNHSFLVEIFYELKKMRSNVFLLMIGDGPDKQRIMGMLSDYGLDNYYKILSNRDDVPSLLNIMDYFVFPSRFEGLPVALIEAQEMRLPCFVSDAIRKESSISNLVDFLPLDLGARKWAEVILNYQSPRKITVNDDDWDIRKITGKLEKIYLDLMAERYNG